MVVHQNQGDGFTPDSSSVREVVHALNPPHAPHLKLL